MTTMTSTTAASTNGSSSMASSTNSNGDSPPVKINLPVVKEPEPQALKRIFALTIFNVLSLPFLSFCWFKSGTQTMLDLWRSSKQPAIDYINIGESDAVEKALKLPSAQVYLNQNALEYQIQEGHCAVATQRNVLKSIPNFPSDKLPCPEKGGGPSTIQEFAQDITKQSGYPTQVVYGSQGYEAFVNALKQSNDAQRYRVAVNFLRSSMFGIKSPVWLPSSWLLAICGGHFSPILGYLEKEQMVAIFDTNHKYGFYLCPTKRLFDAVNTVDVMHGRSRGLIVVDISFS